MGGFKDTNPVDAMWDAMDQLRSGFEKRVGSRMGRGDVRTAILALLDEGPMHGYQIIREIEARTGGRWRPSAGSVYPTLQLLADEGLVSAEITDDRKVYALTDEGRFDAAEAAKDAPWAPTSTAEAGHIGPVPRAGFELAQAAAQVARAGTPEQQKEAAEALDTARRKIYSILAQA
ncbi:PadR family transcriptional regulator [Demequina soli]|uniref:PadR family transcriptional regulator n=1 Tax=Demequina soli TaxID=1638987 RepID=UPI0007845B53|nr:PadR family transcriptional regulator [Demequina soli]